jgi:hypothetical protein
MTRENRQKAVNGNADEALAREPEGSSAMPMGRSVDEEGGEFGLQRLELARLARELGKIATSNGALRDRASLRAARDFLAAVSRDVVQERRARHAELIAQYFLEKERADALSTDTDAASDGGAESLRCDTPSIR